MHVYMYVCIHVYMYVYMCTCMYMYMYACVHRNIMLGCTIIHHIRMYVHVSRGQQRSLNLIHYTYVSESLKNFLFYFRYLF